MALNQEQMAQVQQAIDASVAKVSDFVGTFLQQASDKMAEVEATKNGIITEIQIQAKRVDDRIIEMNKLKDELNMHAGVVLSQTENLHQRSIDTDN